MKLRYFDSTHAEIIGDDGSTIALDESASGVRVTMNPFVPPRPAPQQVSHRMHSCMTCFVKGSKVMVSDTRSKPIEEIEPGSWVSGYNEEADRIEPCRVMKVSRALIKDVALLQTLSTNTTTCSIHQKFMTSVGYLPTIELRAGTMMLTVNGWEPLHSITITSLVDEIIVYHLDQVEPFHNFFVNGLLVHNVKV